MSVVTRMPQPSLSRAETRAAFLLPGEVVGTALITSAHKPNEKPGAFSPEPPKLSPCGHYACLCWDKTPICLCGHPQTDHYRKQHCNTDTRCDCEHFKKDPQI